MQGAKKALVILLVFVVTSFAAYSYLSLANSRSSSGEGGFVGSGNSKTDVTIGVVGMSTFIVGFGLRDVIGRWYGRTLRKKAMATRK